MTFLKKYRFFVLGAAAALLALVVYFTSLPTVLETGSWGLSFPKEGQAPVGNATAETLSAYDAVYVGPEEKTIYLTFDAGYENGNTEKILDILARRNVPAAFFLVGTYMEQHPDLVQRMVNEGHIVGNHTQTHPDMSQIADKEAFIKELSAVEDAYFSITGQKMPKLYRPPRGIYSEENLKMAKELGYKTVFWSLAYVDWYENDQPTADFAFSKLVPRIHDGAIVLLHSTSATNAAILDELLTRWEDLGYNFASIEELFAL